MRTLVKKLPKSQIELEIEVPVKEFENCIEKATLDLGKDLEVEGFRRGHAPKEIIEREIGQEKILKEAAQMAIKENYLKAILENRIEAISQPEIEIIKLAPGNPLVFRAKTPVLPEIKLPDYKKIASEVRKRKVFIGKKEVEESLGRLQKSRAKFSLKTGFCQKGDWIEIEYWSPQIENGKKIKDAFILGQGHLIPGFEENLEGMRNNGEKEFSLVFSENHPQKDYNPPTKDSNPPSTLPTGPSATSPKARAELPTHTPPSANPLAGKRVNFNVKMNLVKTVELPEIDDQFAKNLGQFENLTALKKSLKEGLNLEKEAQERQRIRQEILEKIVLNAEFETPEILIEAEKNEMVEGLKQNLSQRLGISFEDYLTKIKKSEKEILETFLSEAQKRVKNSLVLREISKRENIEVSPEQLKERLNEILKQYSDIEKVEKSLDPEKLKEYTKEVIKNEKTLQLLESLAKTT